jgi:hypothetical protein
VKPRYSACLRPALAALAACLACLAGPLAAQSLALGPGDLRIESRTDGGYDLYVRKKEGLASILLTESTKDPALKADNFAYRAGEYNPVNGDEKRMLNGKALPPNRLFSLISSTPLPDPVFGSAFRILIPPVMVYGYTWSRSGSVAVGKGTFINIRSFARAYADYGGAFMDNPYEISISARPPPPPVPAPPPEQPKPEPPPLPVEPQKEAPPPPADDRTSSKIGEAIEADPGKSLDLVVCLDTTESMVPYIDDIKKNLGPIIRKRVAGFRSFRVGLVLYRDYWPDDYITLKYPFTSDLAGFERSLQGIRVMGGRDIPEAEIEALYAASTEFDWSADRRQIIVVTDAAPHPDPHGKILFDDVARETEARRIDADSIIEPKDFKPPTPGHPEFERESARFAALAAAGAPTRILVYADEASATDRSLLEEQLQALPASLPRSSLIDRPGGSPAEALPRTDASLRQEAAAAAATQLVILRTGKAGALSETVSRLLDAATGKELARDVIWRSSSEGVEAVFVNGLRAR